MSYWSEYVVFFPFIIPILNIQFRTEGFDVKDIELYVDKPDEYFKSLVGSEDLFPVILRFHKDVAKNLNQAKYYYGYMGETELDNCVEIKFLINSYEYIARWIITQIDNVEIIEPDYLKEVVSDLVKKLQKKYIL